MKKLIKYIKNPLNALIWIMNRKIFKIMPDKEYLEVMYMIEMGKKMNLKNSQTFNEKLQWLKLYDRNPEYTKMVDKYEAKGFVANIIGSEYIIPTLGIYDKFEEIDFNKLPEQFVIKCTHNSGGLIICKDKYKLNIEETKNKINRNLRKNYFYSGREWPYKNVKPRIIIEKYMASEEQEELIDYKFFCFNGEPKYLYVSEGLSNHETAKISFADMEYNRTNFYRKDYQPFSVLPQKPLNFEKMKELARKLSEKLSFMRVDFYEIEGKIYFGELTFYPCSGYISFEPEKYDKILGDMLILPQMKE